MSVKMNYKKSFINTIHGRIIFQTVGWSPWGVKYFSGLRSIFLKSRMGKHNIVQKQK